MSEEVKPIIVEAKNAMEQALIHLEQELTKIRAGKASPAMVDSVMVEYYGTPTALAQVANVSVPDGRTLAIKPWEKNLLGDIEKAIFAANLGYTPQSDGETIRINIPPLTEERRKDLAKQIKAEGEHAKVSLRNVRKQANDELRKLGKDGLSEDLERDAEEEVQKITNNYSAKIDKLVEAKENDIMSV